LKSFTEFNSNDRTSVNVWALASYVVTAVVLALAIWYSARLLSTVDAHRGAPNALEEEPGASGLKLATRWYPRGLGVSALAAAIGAFIYANYTPRLSQGLALGLAVLAVAGPLIAAVGTLLTAHEPPHPKAKPLIVVGALAMAVSAVLLVVLHPKWPVWMWSIASSMQPALLLVALARRPRRLQQQPSVGNGNDAADARHFGEVIVTIVALVLVSGAVALLLALLPAVVIRAYGSAAAVLLFLAAAALSLSGIQLVLRRVASNVPGFTTAALAVVALLVALIGDEDLGSETLAPRPQALLNRSGAMARPARRRCRARSTSTPTAAACARPSSPHRCWRVPTTPLAARSVNRWPRSAACRAAAWASPLTSSRGRSWWHAAAGRAARATAAPETPRVQRPRRRWPTS
jgi:hypothetical protein